MTASPEELLTSGSYARKQLFSRSRLVNWSHRSRFRLGREIVGEFAGARLLDYGCGDGTFLAMVADLFPDAVGADIDPHHVEECRERFRGLGGLSFLLTSDLARPEAEGSFGLVACMEVLEHLPEEQQDAVIADLRRLVGPDGTVLISVPVEVGPTLAGKQLARTLAGWRGIGDYRFGEKYAAGEFWKMVFAGEDTAIERPAYVAEYAPGVSSVYHGHKGFNWRRLRNRVRRRFEVRRVRFSPLGWLGGYFSSQVWLVCTPR